MLVLSRQRDESIVIGDDVEITVVDIRADKVRLGISAPREVQVHRKEIYEAIRGENDAASRVQVEDLDGGRAEPGSPAEPPPDHRPDVAGRPSGRRRLTHRTQPRTAGVQ